jgi:hypothetical protein
MSLASQGSRNQFGVAIILISLIPLLAFSYFIASSLTERDIDESVLIIALIGVLAFVGIGYGMLMKYPMNIVLLRTYLERITKGEIPDKVDLIKTEDDLATIETYMMQIIDQTNERIRTIERQSSALIEAERQKVMLESIGAACHHLGQPTTLLINYLDMIKDTDLTPEAHRMIDHCIDAAGDLQDIIQRLQNVGQYDTENYITARPQSKGRTQDTRIIKI